MDGGSTNPTEGEVREAQSGRRAPGTIGGLNAKNANDEGRRL